MFLDPVEHTSGYNFRSQKADKRGNFVNGHLLDDLSELLELGIFSYVPQSVFLFNQSLAFNVAFDDSEKKSDSTLRALEKVKFKNVKEGG